VNFVVFSTTKTYYPGQTFKSCVFTFYECEYCKFFPVSSCVLTDAGVRTFHHNVCLCDDSALQQGKGWSNYYFANYVFIKHTGCPLGYNEFDFLQKKKNLDPLMGAKLRSKTHLINRFF
jgi:hypothetical protein